MEENSQNPKNLNQEDNPSIKTSIPEQSISSDPPKYKLIKKVNIKIILLAIGVLLITIFVLIPLYFSLVRCPQYPVVKQNPALDSYIYIQHYQKNIVTGQIMSYTNACFMPGYILQPYTKPVSQTPKAEPSPTPTPTQINVDDFITYQIPQGWHMTSSGIESPDAKRSDASGGLTQGMNIGLLFGPNTNNNTLDSIKNAYTDDETHNGPVTVTDTLIDGIPAIRFHLDYEGHSLMYYVIKDGYVLQVGFGSPNLSTEQTYQNQINDFINSVRFKSVQNQTITPTPTCTPRPTCLDATPRCMIPELSSYCSPNNRVN